MVAPGMNKGDVHLGISFPSMAAYQWFQNKGGRRYLEQLVLSGARIQDGRVVKMARGGTVHRYFWKIPYGHPINLALRKLHAETGVQLAAYIRELLMERYEDEMLEKEWRLWLESDDRGALASLIERARRGEKIDCKWLSGITVMNL